MCSDSACGKCIDTECAKALAVKTGGFVSDKKLLIDQQEAMPVQPQFAQTYVLLGDQYKKTGQPDYAMQTWRLGLAKFPGDSTLQARIAHP